MSTCLSHLWPERGPMISGTADSVSDAEMLEAAWREAVAEAREERRRRGKERKNNSSFVKK